MSLRKINHLSATIDLVHGKCEYQYYPGELSVELLFFLWNSVVSSKVCFKDHMFLSNLPIVVEDQKRLTFDNCGIVARMDPR